MIEFLKEPLESILSSSFNWPPKPTLIQWGETQISFLDEGIIELGPQEITSPYSLILSCGIHGNETAPIEMICKLLQEVYAKNLTPALPLLIQFGNLEAMKNQERFLEFNLNRLFSGTHTQYKELRESERALVLEKSTQKFAQKFTSLSLWHFDLHTAIRGSYHQKFAIRPFQLAKGGRITQEEIFLLQSFGIEAAVQSHASNTTYSSYSCTNHGATSFTMELGKVRPFGENRAEDFSQAYQGLRDFTSKGVPPQQRNPVQGLITYHVVEELIQADEETTMHLSDDYHNFMPLDEASLIQTTLGVPRYARAGEAVIFPNKKVKVGQRTGLIIAPVENS